MKQFSLTQYLLGIFTALLLFILFFNSQVDSYRHENQIIDILTFLEYDSRIKQQIVELQHGHKKNYGGLISAENVQNRILQGFNDQDSDTYLAGLDAFTPLLGELQAVVDARAREIEIFKRKNAVLRNALHHLPKYLELIESKISTDQQIAPQIIQAVNNIFRRIESKIYKFDAQVVENTGSVPGELDELNAQLMALLPQTLHEAIDNTFTHTSLIIKLHQSINHSIEATISSQATDIANAIYRKSMQDFQQQKERADHYRLWLFMLSMMLLLYLAHIFFRLQRTTGNLQESMLDLEFMKYAIDQHSIVSITNAKGEILYANDQFCTISQYSQQELIGQDHRIIKSSLHDDNFYRDMWRTISQGNKWHGVFANQAKDGSIYWVDSTILPRVDDKGKPYQYIGIRTDITAQKEAEKKIAVLARFPSENPDPVLRVDGQGKILYHNAASQPILQHWDMPRRSRLPDEWVVICTRVLADDQQEEHEIKIEDTYFSILFTPVTSEDYVNLYARDITQIKQAEKNLNYQATHDPLTGLHNRLAFENTLEEALQQAQDDDISSILLYIDLDQFKVVNDTCGHIAGDELLRQISNSFIECIRDSDFVARLGGDEFGVILGNCDLEHGEQIASKILRCINNFRFLWDDKSFEIGASIGMVEIHSESDSVVSLLGEADIACYAAKDAGRNKLQIFTQDHAISQRRDEMQWASRIPKALAENRFILYAQLIKPLGKNSQTQSHYELLVRLQDENGDIVPPGAFIPAAERYGLMHSLDMHVISRAFEQLDLHRQKYPHQQIPVAINLSGHSLGNQHILEYIPDMIYRFNINPNLITFEITETSAISNLTAAIKFIKSLKSIGCQFALDDFGSGLSSFAYLKNLPVDYLKIDGAFVKGIVEDPIDAAMVQSINQIGHVMNIKTIAEFVENEQIEEHLVQIGVDYAQGYGIEKPRPLEDIFAQFAEEKTASNG